MADDEADQLDVVKPWTIKGVPPDIRNAIIAHANREKMALGEWVARAGRAYIQADRQRDKAPVVVGPQVQPQADLAEIERVVAMAAQLAAAGSPPPKAVSRLAYGLLRDRLGAMKPVRQGKPSPTSGPFGQTNEAVSPTGGGDGPTE